MFVLGIDPGLSTTGYGIVESTAAGARAVAAGTIVTGTDLPVADRLRELHDDVAGLIGEFGPTEVAIEEVFVNRNLHTAMSVGRASGVVLLAAASAGLPVFEYTPSAVKLAVTGQGAAAKAQVEAMVTRRLSLGAMAAAPDAYDALAVALCHLQSSSLRRLAGKQAT